MCSEQKLLQTKPIGNKTQYITCPTKKMMDDGSIKNLLVVKSRPLLFWHPGCYSCCMTKRKWFYSVCVLSLIHILTLHWVLPRDAPTEPLSGSHGPSIEVPTSVLVVKVAVEIVVLVYGDTAWGSLISKWLSEHGQRPETEPENGPESPWSPGKETKPAWKPLMKCLLMKGQRQEPEKKDRERCSVKSVSVVPGSKGREVPGSSKVRRSSF